MDRMLLNNLYGEVTLFDDKENIIQDNCTRFNVQNMFLAENDGQFVSRWEVIDYNKGDIILLLRYYNYDNKSGAIKAIVISDKAAANDLTLFLEENTKKENDDKSSDLEVVSNPENAF